jgi:hypothetical protein
MKTHWQYLRYVLRHKYYVLMAGLKLGVPLWRLLIHDWTKFTPAEWGPYARHYYGPKGTSSHMHKTGDDPAFDRAWEHHWRRNPHHWEYWLDETHDIPAVMPDTYIREMVADWYGAGMAQGKPDVMGWYRANKDKMILRSDTRDLVEQLLLEVAR